MNPEALLMLFIKYHSHCENGRIVLVGSSRAGESPSPFFLGLDHQVCMYVALGVLL